MLRVALHVMLCDVEAMAGDWLADSDDVCDGDPSGETETVGFTGDFVREDESVTVADGGLLVCEASALAEASELDTETFTVDVLVRLMEAVSVSVDDGGPSVDVRVMLWVSVSVFVTVSASVSVMVPDREMVNSGLELDD